VYTVTTCVPCTLACSELFYNSFVKDVNTITTLVTMVRVGIRAMGINVYCDFLS
jgi:hypothetical protein